MTMIAPVLEYGAPRPRTAARDAILLMGMSRSGTSLCARLLNLLGAALPAELIGPRDSNPLGHWEPARLVALNDRILAKLGRTWDDPRPLPDGWAETRLAREAVQAIAGRIERDYADAPLPLIKDPRLCRLAPLYLAALETLDIRPLVVLCVRHPLEIKQSLASRDRLSPGTSEMLWLRHVHEAEAATRGQERVWTSFDALLDDWRRESGRIGARLGLRWPSHPDWIADEAARVVQPMYRHWVTEPGGAAAFETRLAARTWKAVRHGLAGDEPAARTLFDEAAGQLAEFDRLGQAYHGGYTNEVLALRASTSWRITAPLRLATDGVRRLARAMAGS